MPDPEIYSIVKGPVLGELGPETRIVEGDRCPVCGGRPRDDVQFLHYAFDSWDGEPLATVKERFAVVQDLRRAIEKAGMNGVDFREMKSTYSDYYEAQQGDRPLPEFVEMVAGATLTAGPGWWTPAGTCDKCGRRIWDTTVYTFNAIVGAHENPNLPKRTVKRSDFHDEDFFMLDDPGPAVISGRFLALLKEQGVEGLEVQPASFID